jgi:dTDP-4-dehydrorhamnose 3,5-epimerase
MEEPFLDKIKLFEDERGYFHQVVQDSVMEIAQINHSFSVKGVLRGMHFQKGQAKYVYCPIGEVFDVVVDMRKDSPTYMQWKGYTLSGKNKNKLYIPEGYAHGFFVVSDTAHVVYAVSERYNPKLEAGFDAFDKDIKIDWPEKTVIQSFKDKKAPSFKEVI